MNTFIFFALLLTVFFMTQEADAHSDKHVHKLCGRMAVKNIMNLCPHQLEMKGMLCVSGELPSVTEYCSMGFSDSQIKFMCCPDQDSQKKEP